MFRKLISGSLVAALMAGTASADTLRDALVSAYNSNPTLTAQRETLRGTDATVAIAKAAGRPTVGATVGLNRTLTQNGLLINGGKGPTVSAGVDLSVPLFPGGRSRIRSAPLKRGFRPAGQRCGRSKATYSPRRSPPTWT